MPGAFGPAYGVSPPSVKFHVTQQLPTGPHPMTTDALVTSNNAISFAQAVENTEREDKQRIEDVSDPCVAAPCASGGGVILALFNGCRQAQYSRMHLYQVLSRRCQCSRVCRV